MDAAVIVALIALAGTVANAARPTPSTPAHRGAARRRALTHDGTGIRVRSRSQPRSFRVASKTSLAARFLRPMGAVRIRRR
jgi:hypothetical protein